MKDLQPYASDFDKYVFSLLEMLRTKYIDVEVLRGKEIYTFKFKQPLFFDEEMQMSANIPNSLHLRFREIELCFLNNHTPQEILNLL